MRKRLVAVAFPLVGVVLSLLAGCGKVETYNAFAGEPPAKPAKMRVDGEVRLVSLNGRVIPGFAPDSAPQEPPGEIHTYNNPDRIVLIDPGQHTIEVGLGRRWLPLLRETHIAVAIFTGATDYSAALYPGSAQNVRITFTAEEGETYNVSDRRKDGKWEIRVRQSGSETDIGNATQLVAHRGDGTDLLPDDWIEQKRQAEKSARRDEGMDDLTKPKAQ